MEQSNKTKLEVSWRGKETLLDISDALLIYSLSASALECEIIYIYMYI
jgi:hypothetical protein